MELFYYLVLLIIALVHVWTNFWSIRYKCIPATPIAGLPHIQPGRAEAIMKTPVARDGIIELFKEANPEGAKLGLIHYHLMGRPTIMVIDGDHARTILKGHVDFSKATQFGMGDYLFGESIFFNNGDIWKMHHDSMSSAFKQTTYSSLVMSTFDKLNERLSAALNEQGTAKVAIYPWLEKAVFDNTGKLSYNYDYGALDGNLEHYNAYFSLSKALGDLAILVNYFNFKPANLTFIPFYKELCEKRNFVYSHLRELYKAAKENPDETRTDVLARILRNADSRLNEQHVLEEMFGFYFAAHDTSAGTMAFTTYFISKAGPEQDLLWKEVSVFFNEHGEDDIARMSLETLEGCLPLLTSYFLESSRLYPAAAQLLARSPTHDQVFLGDIHIPKSTRLLVSTLAIQRNKKTWGEDADEFIPSRFFKNRQVGQGIDSAVKRELLTFGAGSRVCLGRQFAHFQVLLGLAKLVHKYHFALPADSRHACKPISRSVSSLMAPVDLELIITRRTHS